MIENRRQNVAEALTRHDPAKEEWSMGIVVVYVEDDVDEIDKAVDDAV